MTLMTLWLLVNYNLELCFMFKTLCSIAKET